MDFIEQLQSLSAKIQKQRSMIKTEEATKNAFVLPFIGALGYDVFDPSEVLPEFTADVGTKKGEKVDYALIRDGKVIMIFECKDCDTNLDESHASQLYRYFSVTEARIGVLTNGILYRFYTDLEEPNKMDSKPFMELNVLDIQEPLVTELKRMTKGSFDLEEIITVAGDLKYTREIKRILGEQLSSPTDDFVRFFASQVYSGKLTQPVREQFTPITKRAFTQFINDLINERLKSAMANEISSPPATEKTQESDNGEILDREPRKGIITTEEEREGYHIVKAILRDIIDPNRIAGRDTLSCFCILLDDSNRKPVCKLHFNQKQKFIGLSNSDKKEEKLPLENLNDIYKYADRLRAMIAIYEHKTGAND